ncbi:MAG: VanZ family protein [Gallionella sp.]
MLKSLTLLVLGLMLLALFVGGAQPQAVGLVAVPWDKLAHAAFFFVVSLILARFVSLPVALVFVLAMLVGAADEIHKLYLPGRTAGVDDRLADIAGAAIALTALTLKRNGGRIR